ncbi:MAG TPA: hypothetical protein EYG17_01535 [Acidimicrobiia bacterium]|nr:hypothetical protein [Acidimicrobiia bacterium]HIL04717.1 hypothetical protein [Acidimicrobiia bacterium]
MSELVVEQIGAPMGAKVLGLDIRDVDDTTFSQLEAMFLRYHVLVFPQQDLTPEDHKSFARRWGELMPFPYGGLSEHPEIIVLQNRGKVQDVNQHWHSDMTYETCPPKLTMLYCLEAPDLGGETAFANQHLAFTELSEGLKITLAEISALHTAEDLAALYGADPQTAPRAEHPVIRSHDQTGNEALYVCGAFTRRFANWTRSESGPLLKFLFEHSTRPEFQVRHQWSPEDLVMWDNRSVQHFAVHDHGEKQRLIHRLQVLGPAPV